MLVGDVMEKEDAGEVWNRVKDKPWNPTFDFLIFLSMNTLLFQFGLV